MTSFSIHQLGCLPDDNRPRLWTWNTLGYPTSSFPPLKVPSASKPLPTLRRSIARRTQSLRRTCFSLSEARWQVISYFPSQSHRHFPLLVFCSRKAFNPNTRPLPIWTAHNQCSIWSLLAHTEKGRISRSPIVMLYTCRHWLILPPVPPAHRPEGIDVLLRILYSIPVAFVRESQERHPNGQKLVLYAEIKGEVCPSISGPQRRSALRKMANMKCVAMKKHWRTLLHWNFCLQRSSLIKIKMNISNFNEKMQGAR